MQLDENSSIIGQRHLTTNYEIIENLILDHYNYLSKSVANSEQSKEIIS